MKIRVGFVSNSSSASFSIPMEHLSAIQVEAIKQHSKLGKLFGMDSAGYDEWDVSIEKNGIFLDTSMDNFDMHGFLEFIGVKEFEQDSGHWPSKHWPKVDKDFSITELFRHFIQKMPFDKIEKIAKKSEGARALLADPNLELENED